MTDGEGGGGRPAPSSARASSALSAPSWPRASGITYATAPASTGGAPNDSPVDDDGGRGLGGGGRPSRPQ
eukprot:7658730-Pyramimonas_sp.AAC.1